VNLINEKIPYPKTHTQRAVSPNPRTIIPDGQIRRPTDSFVELGLMSAFAGRSLDSDVDPMDITLLFNQIAPTQKVIPNKRPACCDGNHRISNLHFWNFHLNLLKQLKSLEQNQRLKDHFPHPNLTEQ
jgi:hypothetical protein